ncbi:MAG: Hpt domain-containing protein, partial [Gemmatimonadota bacterium]
MPSVREYFVNESREYLGAAREAMAEGADADAYGLLRQSRALRGAAQMAGEEAVARLATAFESGARALARGELAWSDEVGAVVRDTVA